MSMVEFKVDGMKCGGCSSRLKKTIEAIDGINQVDVVLETKQVTVDFDAAKVGASGIREAIDLTGFIVLNT